MNISQVDLKAADAKTLLEELKNIVDLRNKMGGAMYWNVLNDDAWKIVYRLRALGISMEVIKPILGN